MNLAIIAIIALALLGTRRADTGSRGEGGDPTPIEPINFPTGFITYKGVWRRYSKWNTNTDYDYAVVIEGLTKTDQKPLKVVVPDNPCFKDLSRLSNKLNCSKYDGRRNAYSFSKDPQLAFDDAWSLYLSQGGDPTMNWDVATDANYIKYGEKEKKRAEWLSMLNIFFPELRSKILAKIPVDLQDKIKIIIPVFE